MQQSLRRGRDMQSYLTIIFFILTCVAVLVSRQFVDMSRIRIEGLLAAFPKLVGTGKQHTYVETENVRYVYQPIEALYLLLVTNKQSNILEDLDTLRLLSKLVSFLHQIVNLLPVLLLTLDDCFSLSSVNLLCYHGIISFMISCAEHVLVVLSLYLVIITLLSLMLMQILLHQLLGELTKLSFLFMFMVFGNFFIIKSWTNLFP